MNKNRNRGFAILAIIIVIFSVIAFVVPFSKNSGFWCSYIFGVIAVLMQLYVFRVAFRDEDAKSRFYGFPIAKIGFIYLVVQLAVSLAGMLLSTFVSAFPNWIIIVLNIIILGAAAIGCITAETMRDEVEKQDIKLKKDVSVMRDLRSVISSVASTCEDSAVKKNLDALAEEFRYSDPVSNEATEEIERDMMAVANEMQAAVAAGHPEKITALCRDLKGMLAERNRVCKVSK
ncbi:MAG: signal peptidase complex subunit 1 family protein [Lachnospiraceae bacterium]|nr:signal peptidase complex subunit 1 family protein [Lachnospiraceae bacterium]